MVMQVLRTVSDSEIQGLIIILTITVIVIIINLVLHFNYLLILLKS